MCSFDSIPAAKTTNTTLKDYELALLDLIRNRGLEWKGNPNELIASYAADGYAHINGAGAFVTTFGPGELSAYCGMAGQYCEFVLVAHVVGYPNVSAANSHAIMHHTLGTGEFDMYERMAKEITFATVVLRNKLTAAQDIDRALTTMMEQSCPVYIGVPMDIAYAPCSDEGLKAPLATALPANDKATEEKVVTTIRKMLEKATQPAIIVGGSESYLIPVKYEADTLRRHPAK